jgi:hypothetical protein
MNVTETKLKEFIQSEDNIFSIHFNTIDIWLKKSMSLFEMTFNALNTFMILENSFDAQCFANISIWSVHAFEMKERQKMIEEKSIKRDIIEKAKAIQCFSVKININSGTDGKPHLCASMKKTYKYNEKV